MKKSGIGISQTDGKQFYRQDWEAFAFAICFWAVWVIVCPLLSQGASRMLL
ncbi:protein of unknown function [Ruminococcaceae bacterium BL-4]|nr:protein of unknown function [Ruminococcaceae bacterium BL-4]